MWVDRRVVMLTALMIAAGAVLAQSEPAKIDRFTATTTAMTPRDLTLRFDVREWPDKAARTEVVAALAQASDVRAALKDLPTVGYVWQSGSAAGHALKYAHREPTESGERITFVTDKRLDSYEYKPWVVNETAVLPSLEYSVVELYLNDGGSGEGTMSFAAEVKLDATGGLISLVPASGAPRVLANAKLEQKLSRTGGGG
jgi:hypothetical protein